MTEEEVISIVKNIVYKANVIKNACTNQADAPVNYACIFSQSTDEYNELNSITRKFGKVIQATSTGPLYQIKPIETVAGPLRLLKIRKHFETHPQQGDADFTVDNYQKFKKQYLSKPHFNLITRPDFEMIELKDDSSDVLVYFSHPPLDKQLKI